MSKIVDEISLEMCYNNIIEECKDSLCRRNPVRAFFIPKGESLCLQKKF